MTAGVDAGDDAVAGEGSPAMDASVLTPDETPAARTGSARKSELSTKKMKGLCHEETFADEADEADDVDDVDEADDVVVIVGR